MDNKKKRIWLYSGAILLIILIVGAIMYLNKKESQINTSDFETSKLNEIIKFSGSCSGIADSCGTFGTEGSCIAQSGCSWTPAGTCYDFNGQGSETCQGHAGCTFDSCSTANEANCEVYNGVPTGCSWIVAVCVGDDPAGSCSGDCEDCTASSCDGTADTCDSFILEPNCFAQTPCIWTNDSSGSSCDYGGSGNYAPPCNCTITTNQDIKKNNIFFNTSGNLVINSVISNFSNVTQYPFCNVTINVTGRLG